MKGNTMLSFQDASELLSYDPNTGVLTWKIGNGRKIRKGDVAGGVKQNKTDRKKYLTVGVLGKRYRAHRLAVLLMTGKFPVGEVDHENGNGLDNRWENLRDVSCAENHKNIRRQANNTSGVTGVHWRKDCKKWRAYVKENGRQLLIGLFEDFEKAVAARKEAISRLGFHTNHGSDRPL